MKHAECCADCRAVREDFAKVYEQVMRLASRHAEREEAWKGTVSERLKALIDLELDGR